MVLMGTNKVLLDGVHVQQTHMQEVDGLGIYAASTALSLYAGSVSAQPVLLKCIASFTHVECASVQPVSILGPSHSCASSTASIRLSAVNKCMIAVKGTSPAFRDSWQRLIKGFVDPWV